ncbi:unnamed protein product [Chrysoparadoxa australica]
MRRTAFQIAGRGLRKTTRRTLSQYPIYEISTKGGLKRSHTSSPAISNGELHIRDLVSLDLQEAGQPSRPTVRSLYRPPAAILPRGSCVVVALEPFKALVYTDRCIIFDAEKASVKQCSAEVASLIAKNVKDESHDGQEFELLMLEALLQEVCANYSRQLNFLNRIMLYIKGEGAKEVGFDEPATSKYRILPVKTCLTQVELSCRAARKVVEGLLASDEDMLGLLLAEQDQAAIGKGEAISNRHEKVELLLENYHRQLSTIRNKIFELSEEIRSFEELLSMTVDISRNKILTINVKLAMLNLGVASCACLFGMFGMNLVSGIEEAPGVFALVAATGGAGASATYIYLLRMLNGQGSAEVCTKEVNTLNKVLSDIGTVSSLIRPALQGSRGLFTEAEVTREDVMKQLNEEACREVTAAEMDLIFKIFDSQQDGFITAGDYLKEQDPLHQ